MARITVEDCLQYVDNRFDLVLKATKVARKIQIGGAEPLVPADDDKPTVIALREIADGLHPLDGDTVSHEEGESEPMADAVACFTDPLESVELSEEEAVIASPDQSDNELSASAQKDNIESILADIEGLVQCAEIEVAPDAEAADEQGSPEVSDDPERDK